MSSRSPDAVQREAVHRRSGVFANSAYEGSEFSTIPGLQRTTTLRFVLRRARETDAISASLRFALYGEAFALMPRSVSSRSSISRLRL